MRGRVLLAANVLAAILVTASTTVVLLLVESTAPTAEAIKTGGLAGGAVSALYVLWLSGVTFSGRVNMRDARSDGGVSFQHATLCGEVTSGGASVGTFIDVETTSPERHTGAITLAEGSRIAGGPATWPFAGLPPAPARAGA